MTHAWLFTGLPGADRARAFAAELLCPDGGCGVCGSCHQVEIGSHPDLEHVRPEGLSYSVKQARELILRAAGAPTQGRWRVILFEDADRATESAANALLKAIEEPPPRTVWLLCAPSPEDVLITIRSRCRVVRLLHDDVDRPRRSIPRLTDVGECVAAAEQLVKTAEEEAIAATAERNEREIAELRRLYGEGSTGKGLGRGLVRGGAGALKELEDRHKSRATRAKRDSLDTVLLELAWGYRDVMLEQIAAGSRDAERTLRGIDAIMQCRKRLEASVNPQIAVEAMMVGLWRA